MKIQEATSKSVVITEKRKNNVRQIIYINQGIYPQKLPLLLTLQINHQFSDIRFVESAKIPLFLNDCEQMIQMTNTRYKLLQKFFDVNTFMHWVHG